MSTATPSQWDAAIARYPVRPWSGSVWRCHARKYSGDDAGGSLRTTGRYHRGTDKFDVSNTWPALYTSLAIHVALGERLRHTTPQSLAQLANQRISRLRVELHAVLVLGGETGPATAQMLEFDPAQLCHPTDYDLCHHIAVTTRRNAEAMIVPSCTGFPEGNLIVFSDCLRAESSISVEEVLDPDLYVDWTAASL